MIIRKREIPLIVQKLEALQRRTPPDHTKIPIIKENLSKSLAGFKGETSIDFPLSFLPEENYFILHDLRLHDQQHYFQIDTLVLTHTFLLILEVKNITGTLVFDQVFHQLIRKVDEKEEVFPDPLIQIFRQESQLKKWLENHRLPDIPIASLVVVSNPYSFIRTTPENINPQQKIVHRDFLPQKIKQLENLYHESKISEKELKKIIRQLEKQHTPLDQSILNRYQMTKDELIKGVHCTNCYYLPIFRIYGTWYCPACSLKDRNAHLSSLKDYCLLIGSTITNSELRDFLQISSPSLTNRLLKSLNGTYGGMNKARVYCLPFKD
ncbi:nuclease-related domain-containing protein [Bacillus canaveralius]|uniref:nuclease-related domain-containing protein n=1 Tax=Bacillus canaveralius TaxID=1403243 RepID=UPI000F7B601F|nr:nuclease-related domain-containing protein [Bacillus canaveralius]RSK51740.1 NERD domain-containing protein [Bacillus canaveralius]